MSRFANDDLPSWVDADWVDATFVGSNYEQQMHTRTGAWRHRPLGTDRMMRSLRRREGGPFMEIEVENREPWRDGPAPDMRG